MSFLLMNAAGWAKKLDHVKKLARVPTTTHIVMGSFTVEPRDGNTGGTNFDITPDGTAVNSLGLPNDGIPYLEKNGREMVRIVRDAGKIPVISIAGFSPEEYRLLAQLVHELGALAELNIGCPNVHDGGHQKEIVSYNFDLLKATLDATFRAMPSNEVWVKPSPYANPVDRIRFVGAVKRYEIAAIVGCNTFPNVSIYHKNGKPFLDVADNYAGMSGTSMKWINLSQCRDYAERIGGTIIGAGGVSDAQDALDYRLVGCSGVQIGAAFFSSEDLRVFERVAEAIGSPEEG